MSTTTETNNQEVQYIPLAKLDKSPLNARKTAAGCDDLIANIRANGLMQNLSAYKDIKGKKGKYLVFAGGRRLAALRALQEEGHYPADCEIPCKIYTEEEAAELSLAENAVRLAMHPADQFEAFNALIEQGQTAEQVATRFGTTERQVEKLMRLARSAPQLIQEYREGKLALESLMAFTVTDDHAKQLAVYESLDEWDLKRPSSIRNALTENTMEAKHKLVKFVTLETYQAAGGTIKTDLFGDDVYLENPELLQALVSEKLKLVEQELIAEGWNWAIAATQRDWQVMQGYNRIEPEDVDVPQKLRDEQIAIKIELDAIQQEYEDTDEEDQELLDEIEDRRNAAETRLNAVEEEIEGHIKHSPEQMASAGCYAYISHDGTLEIEKGLVRRQDTAEPAQEAAGATDSEEPAPKPKGMPESLKRDLETYRLQVAQVEIAKNPAIAFDLLVFQVAYRTWSHRSSYDGADVSFTQHIGTHAVNQHSTPAGDAYEAVKGSLPIDWINPKKTEAEQFADFQKLPDADKHALLAYCVAETLKPKLAGDTVATAYDAALALTGADVAAYWRPTKDNYLSRVTSSQLLEIGQEIFGGNFSTQYAKAKKGELVALLDKGFANPEKAMDRDKVNRLMNWLPAGMAFSAAPEPKPAKAKKKAA